MDALLAKDKNEARYDAVSELARKVGGKVLVAMAQRTACGPTRIVRERAQDGGRGEMGIGIGTQDVEATKSDSGSGSFLAPLVRPRSYSLRKIEGR